MIGLELIAPRRLGTGFRWLMASTWVSNAGDGIALAAGPLLVAQQTDEPFLVALAAFMVWTPPFLFGLWAGALTDRLDRGRLVIAVNVVRVVVLVLFVGAIVTGRAPIAVVLATLFVLGTAEVFVDNASTTLLPMLVHRNDLAIGQSRLQTGFITLNQLAGPPVGAALFAVGAAWPFASQAVLVAFAAMLIARVRLPYQRRSTSSNDVWADIRVGFRWTIRHDAVRTLIVTILVFNVTFGAAWSVLVLYATEHLGLGEVGFGLVTTVSALGGLVGTAIYGRITRYVTLADLMRIGLVVETVTHLGLALTSNAAVALAIFFVFGIHAFVWGTTSTAIRQRAVPEELQGRVGGVHTLGVFGGLAVGSGVGGVVAQIGGITAPFWFGFAGSVVLVALLWRQFDHIALADAD